MNRTTIPAALLLALAAGGCGGPDSDPAAAADEPAAMTEDAAPAEAAPAGLPRSMAPADARLYFVTPADGDTVASPVSVEFGLSGMDVVPAGTQAEASGHHHVIIDADLPPFDLPIPADEHHVHFGDGSTATDLALAPGEHRLQLLLGDHLHIPHEPPVYSEPITITVE